MRAAASLCLVFMMACSHETQPPDPETRARLRMVDNQIADRGVSDRNVLEAMRRIPRHRFMPQDVAHMAYEDHPVPIGYEQTISQPYIVGYMTEQLRLKPEHRVLEIGTGSGYQAAVLAEIAKEVYTIEIVEPLARHAGTLLKDLGYSNVHVRAGDGYRGWPEAAPFDAIIVTAAPDHVPPALIEQLAVGGRLVIPVGRDYQEMTVITKTDHGVTREETIAVRFVPMTGEAQRRQ